MGILSLSNPDVSRLLDSTVETVRRMYLENQVSIDDYDLFRIGSPKILDWLDSADDLVLAAKDFGELERVCQRYISAWSRMLARFTQHKGRMMRSDYFKKDRIVRVTISNMAWIAKEDIEPVGMHLYQKQCTVIPKRRGNTEPIRLWRETEQYFGIPRFSYREVHRKLKHHVKVAVSEGTPLLSEPTKQIKLRDFDQEPIVEDMYRALTQDVWGIGCFEAYTGFGKTIVALELIRRLGGNACILVHNTAIAEMWLDDLRTYFGNAKTVLVQGQGVDFHGADFAVAIVQTLMEGNYGQDFFQNFRTLCVDEVHRYGASEFGGVIPNFSSKYLFGMSGTVRRKDGAEEVFRSALGPVITSANPKFRINPFIYVRSTDFDPENPAEFAELSRPKKLDAISRDPGRIDVIAKDVIRALRAGRYPLVMSERKALLDGVYHRVEYYAKQVFPGKDISQGFFISGEDTELVSKCDVILATVQMAKEGINIPRLDTLLLGTPLSDVEQVIGRVCRPIVEWVNGEPQVKERSKPIMVCDFVDHGIGDFDTQYGKRYEQYLDLGWRVHK